MPLFIKEPPPVFPGETPLADTLNTMLTHMCTRERKVNSMKRADCVSLVKLWGIGHCVSVRTMTGYTVLSWGQVGWPGYSIDKKAGKCLICPFESTRTLCCLGRGSSTNCSLEWRLEHITAAKWSRVRDSYLCHSTAIFVILLWRRR